MHWLVIGGGILLVVALVLLRRRLMDDSGPGRLSDVDPVPWDGRPRRASDRAAESGGSRASNSSGRDGD